MSRTEDACPFEPQSRANRCQSCVTANSIPPCAAAFLSGKPLSPAGNVIELRRIETVPAARKAA